MTDLEITKLCAEAMEEQLVWLGEEHRYNFDPLHDDAQAMALVKKFRIDLDGGWDRGEDNWLALVEGASVTNTDLNRAICECVAKMQVAKVPA